MAKFYIESGDIKIVTESKTPFGACVKAIKITSAQFADDSINKTVNLSDTFMVNETGFPSERIPYSIHSGEHIFKSETVMKSLGRGNA